MDLSPKEEYRNQRVSLGVTLLSFVVMLAFFIFTNVITANPPHSSNTPAIITLDMDNASHADDEGSLHETALLSASKNENVSDDMQPVKGDVVVKSPAYEIADKYKTTTRESVVSKQQGNDTPVQEGLAGKEENRGQGTTDINSLLGYDLAERIILVKPKYAHTTHEQGKVVVEITVDKNGIVTEAVPNGRGTTTSSVHLRNEATKMALATLFNKDMRQEEQKGTITIIFSFD